MEEYKEVPAAENFSGKILFEDTTSANMLLFKKGKLVSVEHCNVTDDIWEDYREKIVNEGGNFFKKLDDKIEVSGPLFSHTSPSLVEEELLSQLTRD
jgi:hypothetical protein